MVSPLWVCADEFGDARKIGSGMCVQRRCAQRACMRCGARNTEKLNGNHNASGGIAARFDIVATLISPRVIMCRRY